MTLVDASQSGAVGDGDVAVSLDDLKAEYLELDTVLGGLTASANEVYWKQGRILNKIKAKVGHGKWLRWVNQNLSIGQSQAKLRMLIGSLPSLPKSPESRRFDCEQLAEVAQIAMTLNLSPDAAVEKWQKNHGAADKKGWERMKDGSWRRKSKPKPPRPPGARAMSREEAFKTFGITVYGSIDITKESLDILFKGLRQIRHPDKGGSNDQFVSLTKAYEVLS